MFSDLLTRRVRTDGAQPLITCYSDQGRTELSAVTYANWVAKTATMIIDTLEAEPGDGVALPLLAEHPGHWMGLVWAGACFTAGTPVLIDSGDHAVIEVSGPSATFRTDAEHRLACSLHPLALGVAEPLPTGVLDWATEVRSEPDVFIGAPPTAGEVAWVDPGRRLTQAELITGPGTAERHLLDLDRLDDADDAWTIVRAALLEPLLGGGSSVVVIAGDAAAIGSAENARPPA